MSESTIVRVLNEASPNAATTVRVSNDTPSTTVRVLTESPSVSTTVRVSSDDSTTPVHVLNESSSNVSTIVRVSNEAQATVVRVSQGLITNVVAGVLGIQGPPGEPGASGLNIPPFSKAGVLTVSTSPRWYTPDDVIFDTIRVSLQTAGSTSTTITVTRDGVDIDNYVLGAGDTFEDFTPDTISSLSADSYIDVGVTVAGTGAADLTVQFI